MLVIVLHQGRTLPKLRVESRHDKTNINIDVGNQIRQTTWKQRAAHEKKRGELDNQVWETYPNCGRQSEDNSETTSGKQMEDK